MALENLLTRESQTEPYLRNIVELVRALIPDRARVDLVRMQGHLFVVVGEGPYTYRFAVPPDERMWVAEYRNDICDPPLQYDHCGDGPLATADQQSIANWIVEAAVPEVETETCRTCGSRYPEAGDGWDGECPECADKREASRG